jgi:hypothetical protein
MHRRIPKQRAALIAQSVLQLQPEHEQARAILIQAYDNSKDPRLLEVLDTDTGEHLQRTLKAIEQGNLTEAQASFAHPSRILRASFAHLQPGSSVDAVSYHEIGTKLFRNEPEQLYAYFLVLSEAEPDHPSRTSQLVYTCLMTGHAVPLPHLKRLTELALEQTDEIGGDALAASLALAIARPHTTSPLHHRTHWATSDPDRGLTVGPPFLLART